MLDSIFRLIRFQRSINAIAPQPGSPAIAEKKDEAASTARKSSYKWLRRGIRWSQFLFQVIGALVVALFALWKTLPQDTQKHVTEDAYFQLQPKADIRIEPMRVAESCNSGDQLKSTSGAIATYVTDVMTRNAIRYLSAKGLRVYSSRTAQGLDRVPVRYSLELTLTCTSPLPNDHATQTENIDDPKEYEKEQARRRAAVLAQALDDVIIKLWDASFTVNLELTRNSIVESSVPIPLNGALLISKYFDRKSGINSDAIMAAIFETMPLPSDLQAKLKVPSQTTAAGRKYGIPELMQYRAAESVFAGGDRALAESLLMNAVETNPKFAIGYSALAEIKRSEGKEDEAQAFDKKATGIDKDYPRIPFTTKINNPAPSIKKALANLEPTKVVDGASVLEVEIKSPQAKFYAFNFDPKLYRLSIGVAPTSLGETARQFRTDESAVFSIVGGMFDADTEGNKQPSGLLVRRGVILANRHSEWSTGGFLTIRDGSPEIFPISQFARDKFEVSEDVLQSSLLVVDPGGRNGIRGRTPELADRAAVCVQPNGNISFVIAKGLFQLFDFADLLVDDKAHGGLGCERAMYLDGGPSAQASLALGSKSIDLEGQWVIPNAIIVHRRTP
ncbi:uncharacterized protein YigE (DUF2233 family) [Bradyrhizobium sp. USDA 4524]|uniref:phosphodiester glycosidase family protein n=1 Tax=unclassified Bradyrhizobium TaxID=2631580 RepID=UPI00209C847B|nr:MULTISPECIES: phosphodiester glycosidase family protein [unclassified Bradyrhizobium]MCP1842148.1 uncharacterized protein YigE (DUF2233 family) [Bradyrhizobium sp. USDA 4538]MCP1902712.1 uncharacterized protein YigE (DUF2233 family) [Bradyrhizobium sp. USDA 4537]MCP1991631.1 uncharacterized protein YigE (DUF2233 family) [Bradyrhizobium sp. USDA 4539]